MLYPTLYGQQIPERWAGRTLTDARLSKWLAEEFEYRRIGRVVKGPAWPELKPVISEPPPSPPGLDIRFRVPHGVSGLDLSRKRTHNEVFTADEFVRHIRRKQE